MSEWKLSFAMKRPTYATMLTVPIHSILSRRHKDSTSLDANVSKAVAVRLGNRVNTL